MTTFGERLKQERQRLRLSQESVAKVGGVRKNTQSLYEAGRNVPDADYLMRLHAIGVDVYYLLTGAQSANALSAHDQQLLALFNGVDTQTRAMVIMTMAMLQRIGQLPAPDQLEDTLWQSVAFIQRFLDMSEAEKQELEQRLNQAQAASHKPPSNKPP
jgi:transcriptional regulator with XRE-family HTH domain